MNRWKVDESYYPLLEQSSNPLISNGVFPFSEPVLVTYIDLDRLISSAPLTIAERKVVDWFMRGYATVDIAEHCGTSAAHVNTLLKRASEKIADEDLKSWGNINYGGECSFEPL